MADTGKGQTCRPRVHRDTWHLWWGSLPALIVVGAWTVVLVNLRRWQLRSGVSDSSCGPATSNQPGGPVLVVRGGARVGWLNVTWPLAELSFNKSFLQIRVLMLHPIYVSREEVIGISTGVGRQGVRAFDGGA